MIIFLILAVAYLFIDSLFATHWIQKLERRIIDLEQWQNYKPED